MNSAAIVHEGDKSTTEFTEKLETINTNIPQALPAAAISFKCHSLDTYNISTCTYYMTVHTTFEYKAIGVCRLF